MTNCNINIRNSKTVSQRSGGIKQSFSRFHKALHFKMNPVKIVKYSINRACMFAFAEFNIAIKQS